MTFYDLAAPVYGVWAALTESKAHRRAVAALIECPIRNLLEVAVGTCTECAKIQADPTLDGCLVVDLSMAMLKRARRRLEAPRRKRALLCQADARALPFRAGSFDGLLNCYMIDLLSEADIPAVMQEFRRVLCPDGRLLLVPMARQKPIVQELWMWVFRHFPLLVGGCRPLDVAGWLRRSGWQLERQEQISQMGVRSELFVARPSPPQRAGA